MLTVTGWDSVLQLPASGHTCLYVNQDTIDHFEVQVVPDTISHSDTASIIVRAKDRNDNSIAVSGATPLYFRLDANGERYGGLMAPDGNRGVALDGIAYADARSGRIRYIADGEPPDTIPQIVAIGVVRSGYYNKRGSGVVWVVPPTIRIRLDLGKKILRPLANAHNKPNPNYNPNGPDRRRRIIDTSKVKETTITIAVTDAKNRGRPGYPFLIRALVKGASGGHDHTDTRPTGRFITPEGDTVSVYRGKTGSDGKARLTYRSSGYGGIDSIFVQGSTPRDTASATVHLKMGDFELLTRGEHYRLIGAYGQPGVNSRHSINHYGTATLVKKLKALADTVYARSGYVLRINDMSLIYGGPFDIENNWNTPHETHREGIDADIDDMSADGRHIPRKYLEDIVVWTFGGDFLDEKNHYHVTFR